MPPSTVPGRTEKKNKTKKESVTRRAGDSCRWIAAIEMWFVVGTCRSSFQGVSWYISLASSAFGFTPGLTVGMMMPWLRSD